MTNENKKPKEIHGAGGGRRRGGGGGGQQVVHHQTVRTVYQPAPKPYVPTRVDDDEFLRSVSFAKMQYLLCEGEIEGPALGDTDDSLKHKLEKSVFVDGTPLRRGDSTIQFEPEDLVLSTGTPEQSAVPDYDYVESPTTVGRVVLKDLPVSQFIDVPDVGVNYRARVMLTFNNLYVANSRGDIRRTTVVYKIQYTDDLNVTRDVTPAGGESLTGKFSSSFVRQHQFDLEGQPPWNVTVTRVTQDDSDRSNGSTQYGSTFNFENIILSLKQKLRYPCSSILTVGLKADTYNQIPNISLRLKGTKIQVPSNYNPTTREYTGTWDGTFKSQPEYTNNPAWVFYALVTNERWGLGEYIEPALVDKWMLYDIGRYCDQQVRTNNSNTQTEPRFTCNLLLQTAEDAWVVLQQVSSIFRGMLYYSGGTIVPVQNRNRTGDGTEVKPVFLFNESNTISESTDEGAVSKGNFTYSGAARRARHTVVLVSYDDQDQQYENRVEYIADEESLQRFGYRPLDLRLIGVTSRGQALRAANWALLTEKLLDDTVTFKTNELGSVVRPGDLIEIADPNKTENQARRGGRIASISGNTVVLDSSQQLPNGVNGWNGAKLYFMVRGEEYPRMEYGTVSTIQSGIEVTLISWQSAARPLAGDPWLLEMGTSTGGVTYRVLAVSEEDPGIYAVSALRYRGDLYDNVDSGTPLQDSESFELSVIRPSAPTINAAVLTYTSDVVKVVASWTTPNASVERYGLDTMVEEYVLQYQGYSKTTTDRDGVWTTIGDIRNNKLEFSIEDYDEDSNYKIRVAAVTRLGTQSDWSPLFTVVNQLESTPLPSITGTVDDPNFVDPGDGSTAPQVDASTLSYIPNPDGTHTFFWSFNTALPSYVSGIELEAKPATTALTSTQEQLMGLTAANADGYYVIGNAVLDSNFTWQVPMSKFSSTSETVLVAPFVQPWTVRMRLTTYIENTKGSSYRAVTMDIKDIVPPTPRDFFVSTEVQRRTEPLLRSFSWIRGYGTENTSLQTGYERDIDNYQIRYITSDQVFSDEEDYWTAGITLDSGVVKHPTQNFETSLVPVGNWKVMIRAFDSSGFASSGFASINIESVGRLPANIVGRFDCRDNRFMGVMLQGTGSTVFIDNFHPYVGNTTGRMYRDDIQDEMYELETGSSGAVAQLQPTGVAAGLVQLNSIFHCNADGAALQVAVDTALSYKMYLRKIPLDSLERPQEFSALAPSTRTEGPNNNYIYARGRKNYGYTPLFGVVDQDFYPPDPSIAAVDADGRIVDRWYHFYEPTVGYVEEPYHQYQDGEKLDEGFYEWALLAFVDTTQTTEKKVIRDIDFIMDYPDVIEQFEDLFVPAEGLTVNLTRVFREINATSTAFQTSTDTTGTSVQVVDKSPTQIKLKVFQSPGVSGDGFVDLLVAGY